MSRVLNWTSVLLVVGMPAVIVADSGTDPFIVYGDGTSSTPVERLWSGTSWGTASGITSIGGTPSWIVLANCTVRDELLLATLDTGKDLNVVEYDGSSWGSATEHCTNTGSATYRPFYLAYEKSSGDALLVYRDNMATDLSYRTFNGTSWSSESTTTSPVASKPNFIKLVAKPTSDEIMLVVLDDSGNVGALVWTGSAWTGSQALESGGGATASTCECFDIGYEGSTGDALVVWGESSSTSPRYRTWNGSSWSGESSAPSIGSNARWIRLAADSTSDKIILMTLDGVADLNTSTWSGSAFGSNTELETNCEEPNPRNFDVVFEPAGTNALAVYIQDSQLQPRYRTFDGTSWSSETLGPSAGSDIESNVQLRAGASGSEILIAMVQENNVLWGYSWDGSTFASEGQLESGVSGSLMVECFMIGDYPPDSPTSITLADHDVAQETDAFTESDGETDAELFAFKLSQTGSPDVTELVFRLTNLAGLANGDWGGVEIIVDADDDGSIGGGESTAVGGAGVVDQAAGTITFSTTFTVSADTHYILRADFASLASGDTVHIALAAADIASTASRSGSTTSVIHAELLELGDLLLVVADTSSLDAQEELARDLMLGWGYDVVTISDHDSQANFDTALAAADVVYVSQNVNSGDVGTKVKEALIGVVLEENALSDEMGFSASYTSFSDDETDIIDNTHYITEVFSTGVLAIFDSAQDIRHTSGSTGAYTELAEKVGSNSSALAVLNIGDSLYGGGTAAGRRVYLPFGGTSLDLGELTADGETIIERSLQWAMGVYDLLMVVGNTGSLTSQETARKTQFELWGYDVALINDSDSQATFDTAIALADLAYVSEEVNAMLLDTKLLNAAIGVVTEAGDSFDAFDLTASNVSNQSGTQIDIQSYSHYITAPFATGNLTIVSSSEPMNKIDQSIGAGGQTLAEWPASSSKALVVVDQNGKLQGGTRAAGRRVFLPIGDDLFDFDTVNFNGLTIVKRSLEWSRGMMAHWKLDETGGTTASEEFGNYDATLTNMDAGSDWVSGRIDNGLDFDGVDDYAITSSIFTPPAEGTVAFWMKVPGSPGSHGRIFGIDDEWEVRHVTTGTADGIPYGLVFDLGWNGVNTTFVTTTTVDTANQWYHIAATYSVTTGAYAVYIDGTLHKSGTTTLALPVGNQLSIGTRTGSSNYFVGTLDDIRIMDYMMTADEVSALHAMGSSLEVSGWMEVPR